MAKGLTKYISAETIVTADVANSWFGGLYGSAAGSKLSSDDPRVCGHVHDGEHKDGHSGKVDLVDHVTGKLRNSNIADDAVDKRVVSEQLTQGDAIPEKETVDGTVYYFLDLSDLRNEITTAHYFTYDSDLDAIRENPEDTAVDYDSTDFVFGSPQLEDDGYSSHATRLYFDKSKGAFRAGTATDTQWDASYVGNNSIATGNDNTATGNNSAVIGGEGNITESLDSVILGGIGNTIDDSSRGSAIIGGLTYIPPHGGAATITTGLNSIDTSTSSVIIAAKSSIITNSDYTAQTGGINNTITSADYSFSGGGSGNSITTASASSLIGGGTNSLTGDYSVIAGGATNEINVANYSAIISGYSNEIISTTYSIIMGGNNNSISAQSAAIVGGTGHTAAANATSSAIVGGTDNTVTGANSVVLGGQENIIYNAPNLRTFLIGGGGAGVGNNVAGSAVNSGVVGGHSNDTTNNNAVVVGGTDNSAAGESSVVLGGYSNTTQDDYSAIVAGYNQEAIGIQSVIVGGEANTTNGLGNFIAGAYTSETDGEYSAIIGGYQNAITETGTGSTDHSIIIGGSGHALSSANGTETAASGIICGVNHTISDGDHSVILGGSNNVIKGGNDYNVIIGGTYNQVIGGEKSTVTGIDGYASMYNQHVYGSTQFGSNIWENAQMSIIPVSRTIGSTDQYILYPDGDSASKYLTFPPNKTFFITAYWVLRYDDALAVVRHTGGMTTTVIGDDGTGSLVSTGPNEIVNTEYGGVTVTVTPDFLVGTGDSLPTDLTWMFAVTAADQATATRISATLFVQEIFAHGS